jgi:hypothetical protein
LYSFSKVCIFQIYKTQSAAEKCLSKIDSTTFYKLFKKKEFEFINLQFKDSDLFPTSKIVPSFLVFDMSTETNVDLLKILLNSQKAVTIMIARASEKCFAVISILLSTHPFFEVVEKKKSQHLGDNSLVFPTLDNFRPCLDLFKQRCGQALLQTPMEAAFGRASSKPLFLMFYDFECHSESMHPCSLSFSIEEFSNSPELCLKLKSGEELISKVFEELSRGYGSNIFLKIVLPAENNNDSQLVSTLSKLLNNYSIHDRRMKIYWFEWGPNVFVHIPGAIMSSECFLQPTFTSSHISLVRIWVDILTITGTILSFGDGANIFIYAHNNSRFDLILFVSYFLREICSNPQHWGIPKYLQNGGRIIRLDVAFNQCVDFMFRDSILLAPTNSRSLQGVATELKLKVSKKSFDFWMLDACLNFIAQDTQTTTLLSWEECLEQHFIKKHHQHLLTGCSPVNCKEPLECKKVESLTFNVETLPSSVEELEAMLCVYNMFDVIVLKEIVLLIYKDYIAPHFVHIDNSPYSILNCGTLASIAYKEMTNSAISNISSEFEGSNVKMYLAQGIYDVFMRKSIFGGRCVSSCISNSNVGYSGKWFNKFMNKQVPTPNFNSWCQPQSMLWLDDLRCRKITSWSDMCKYFIQNTKSCEQDWDASGFLQSLVHVDISSMYPSALCSPMPVGTHSIMTNEDRELLNSKFAEIYLYTTAALKTMFKEGCSTDARVPLMYQAKLQNQIRSLYNPFVLPPFVAMCYLHYPEDLYNYAYENCSFHHTIIFGHVPMHTRDYERNLFSAKTSQTHWAIGSALPVILSCVDLFLLARKGPWLIRITEALTWSHWSDSATQNTFKEWYKGKSDAEREGNAAKRYILKVKMNSSYGGCAVNSRFKKTYELDRFSDSRQESLQNFDPIFGEMDPTVGEEEIQAVREDHEIRKKGYKSSTNSYSVYRTTNSNFDPKNSEWNQNSGLPMSMELDSNTSHRVGVFREIDHRKIPITSFGRECQNARYAPFSIFCLSFSRLLFDEMLLEPVKNRVLAGMECANTKDARWSDFYYTDTDSMTLSLRLALYYSWNIRGPVQIGVTDPEKMYSNFSLAVECCDGAKACPFWSDHGISGMPCLRLSSVFGRKNYQEFCMCCNKSHIRAKGQNLKDQTVAALNVYSTKLLSECARWESRKLLSMRLSRNHSQLSDWEMHRKSITNLKGVFLHKVPFRACLLKAGDNCHSWKKHHKKKCISCKKSKKRLLTDDSKNNLSTSRFAMKIHLFKKDKNILTQPHLLHSLEESGDCETQNNHQSVIHPSQGYSITGDSVLTRQFSPNPDADLLPCRHCQLQLPQYVHFKRRGELLKNLFDKSCL